MHLSADHRCWRVGAHATRVGAFVFVQQSFVVLAGGQGHHIFTIAHHNEAGLFALQKFFNDHAGQHSTVRPCVVNHAQGVV